MADSSDGDDLPLATRVRAVSRKLVSGGKQVGNMHARMPLHEKRYRPRQRPSTVAVSYDTFEVGSTTASLQATSAAMAKSALHAAAKLPRDSSPVAAAPTPPRPVQMSPHRRSAAPPAAAQSDADAQLAASSSRPKIRLPAFHSAVQPVPSAASSPARAQPSSSFADPASPLLIHMPSHTAAAAAEQPHSPAAVTPAAEAVSEQAVSPTRDGMSVEAVSPQLLESAPDPAAEALPEAAVARPGSPPPAAPTAAAAPEPADDAIPKPTIRRQRSLSSRKPRLQAIPAAPDAGVAATAAQPGMATGHHELAAAAPAATAAATAAAAATVVAAAVAAADVQVHPPAPSLAVAEEAAAGPGLMDAVEEQAADALASAPADAADPEQAALLQWEEDTDAEEDQAEAAAEQVQNVICTPAVPSLRTPSVHSIGCTKCSRGQIRWYQSDPQCHLCADVGNGAAAAGGCGGACELRPAAGWRTPHHRLRTHQQEDD